MRISKLLSGMCALIALCCIAAPAQAALKVGATIYPVYDLVRQIGGARVAPFVIVPPGASPHTFAPTPQLMARMEQADLIIGIGLGLDSWVSRSAGARPRGENLVLLGDRLRQAGAIEPDEHAEHQHEHEGEHAGHEHEGEDDGHHHGDVDPHVWLSPRLLPQMIGEIAAELTRLDPAGAALFSANAQRLRDELKQFDEQTARLFSGKRGGAIVVVHGGYGYLCEYLGIEQLVIAISPGAEPSARSLAGLIEQARGHGVGAVFREPQLSPRAAEALAAELGVPLKVLDPLGGPGSPGGETLLGLLRYDVEQIAASLGGAAR